MIGSRHDVLDEKEKKKSKGEVAGQSRLVKLSYLSRDVVALFRAARIACTGEYGPFEELSFGGLDKAVRICESENGFYLLRQRDCTFGFGRAGVGKRGGWNKNKNKNHLFFLSSYPLYIQIPPEKRIPSFSLFTSPSLSQRPRPPAPELHGIEIDISRCKS